MENASSAFEGKQSSEKEVDPEKLYAKIGQLEIENDFLKKLQESSDCEAVQESC